jgi:hypothetical protein
VDGPRRGTRAEWALAAGSALAVALAALAAEGMLRLLSPAFLDGTRARHPHVYSEVYGWALRPSSRYAGKGGETITVNGRGYRGPAHAQHPPPGVTRIVMLGDSVAFGSGVSDGETFSAILDARPDVEVVNLAVDGYGTDQALLRLEREGLSYRPRAVVLNFCVRNDYFDNALPVALYDGRSPKPYFTAAAEGLVLHDAHLRLGRGQRAAVALMERSYLLNALLFAAGRKPEAVGGGRDEEDWGGRRNTVLADFDRAAALTRRLILRARDASARVGAVFVVAVHPDRRAWSGDGSLVTPLTSGGLEGTRIVLMQGEYAARGLAFGAITRDRLGHLNPAGHAAAARILEAVLIPPPGGAHAALVHH